ncbi:MAG: transglutaminaseTgpA domain-containing protein [Solirubrobacteraceae bacterium]
MSAIAAPTAAIGGRAVDRRVLPSAAVRLVAFAAFTLLAALQWGVLLAPSARGRLAVCAVVAVLVAVVAHRCAALERRRFVAAQIGLALAGFVAVLLAAGVPQSLLRPDGLGDLVSSLAEGVQSLPTIGVPYRGVDPWIRIVLLAGGGLLLVWAALLVARALRRDRRPIGAALVLSAAYVIPIVERSPSHPFAWGLLFTLLIGVLLWGDRIERGSLVAAAVFVAVGLGGALVAAPRLDAAKPWVDYQAIVESLSTPPAVGFDWNHGYGPLDWPRENRVMLRVASDRPHYWKAIDLDEFDGERWINSGRLAPGDATQTAPNHADWTVDLRVTVRDLRSPYYIGAGTGFRIEHSPRFAIASAPGTFSTGRDPLRRGDSYSAQVYVPNPSIRELRTAGTDYPTLVSPYLQMGVPAALSERIATANNAPVGPSTIAFPEFSVLSERTPPTALDGQGRAYGNGGTVLEQSEYREMYALARSMRARADTPYELVREVQERLADGYAYTEEPPRPAAGRPPLVSFLFDSRRGYCQQFSGTMALLLRMGGVPARVSSGFSPGTFDGGRDEWVVRDVDAHSWVEVYFPRLGWVTFDPTPGVAPPHTQLLNGPAPLDAKEIPLRPDGSSVDLPPRAGAGGGTAAAAQDGGSSWPIVALVLVAAGLGLVALVVVRRRRQVDAGGPAELAELLRALRLTGRVVDPTLTLHALEHRFRGAPAAAAYVGAVRLARYGGRPAPPTREQRAALRTELAEGLGPTGRVRAWIALPPLLSRQ